jgi:antitoxin (DNA-binding transcriptional repressor) of toxin-antitoxin stability system
MDEAVTGLVKLIELAGAGEDVIITKDGHPAVRLVACNFSKQQLPSLVEFRAQLPFQDEPASVFIRRMRDEDRY